jgi:hypothetical protein
MATLKKATLQEIDAKSRKPVDGTEFEVQFNPASLKLDLANKVEGGHSLGKQRRQFLGNASTTLTFDLHFDTADEGTPDKPVSVRTRTAAVERFLRPKAKGKAKQVPPRARFIWDELKFDGIIESLSIDLDLFSGNGTPLRAKMGVSIKEQDPEFELLVVGAGANQAINAPLPGRPGTGPGTHEGETPADTTAPALEGESAADFAARMGLDPSAWRGIAAQLGASSSLSLQAGASIDFSSSLSASAGIGFSAGVEAGASASLGASFGLDANASATASASFGVSASGDVSAGFALSAAGGVGAAIETVAIVRAESAASDARRSFGSAVPSLPPPAPAVTAQSGATAIGAASTPASSGSATSRAVSRVVPPSITPRPSMPEQSRTPLHARGLPSPSEQVAAPRAPAPPLADPRATSFGFGVPLRSRVGSAADLRASAAAGRVPLRPRSRVADALAANGPTTPPWRQLPPSAADRPQSQRPARRCGCGGPCHHGVRTCR